MSMSGDDGVPSSQQVDQLLGSSKLALAIENDKYKDLLDNAPVAVAVSRGSGAEQQVVYANRAFEGLLSLAPSDVEGRGWLSLNGFLNEDNPARRWKANRWRWAGWRAGSTLWRCCTARCRPRTPRPTSISGNICPRSRPP